VDLLLKDGAIVVPAYGNGGVETHRAPATHGGLCAFGIDVGTKLFDEGLGLRAQWMGSRHARRERQGAGPIGGGNAIVETPDKRSGSVCRDALGGRALALHSFSSWALAQRREKITCNDHVRD
jgi:hypothetical protein